MKNLIFLIAILVFGIFNINAQDIQYSYDANGARIQRKVIVMITPMIQGNDTTVNGDLIANTKTNGAGNTSTDQAKKRAEELKKKRAEDSVKYAQTLNNTTINIYPNPTVGQLNINFSDLSDLNQGSISVFDNTGRLISSNKVTSTQESVDISNEAKGNYIIMINLNGVIREWKVIKM